MTNDPHNFIITLQVREYPKYQMPTRMKPPHKLYVPIQRHILFTVKNQNSHPTQKKIVIK